MKLYRFIDCQKAEFKIKTLCRVCEVATSSYYAWASAETAGPDEATWDEAILANRIYDAWARSRGRYAAPRVTAQLWREGTQANHKRVERIMAELGLQGACGRRKLRTTVRDPDAVPAADLVGRHFASYSQDSLWIGDLTYIPTGEGWLYLATVIDTCSRRLLGIGNVSIVPSDTSHRRSSRNCEASKKLHKPCPVHGGNTTYRGWTPSVPAQNARLSCTCV